MAMPDLEVPVLSLSSDGPGRFHLKYSFAKPGYAPVFLGLLRAMADDYGELVLIDFVDMPESSGRDAVFDILVARAPAVACHRGNQVH